VYDSTWDALCDLASAHPTLTVLDDHDADAFVDRLAERFVDDRGRTWWWQGLDRVVARVAYDDDGLGLLHERIGDQLDVRLVVTDERSEPFGVIAGPAAEILRLLGEAPYGEFALADSDLRWVAFDTHHNEFILAGEPPAI
jgi:hypothetical protein